ncbi:MAG: hypothetical protein RMN25_08750 [Anaerolineae bacterium]|nr:hypothetical protein [Thermoflexales bacterium]MDW8407862.1 hypothetical protein [Anaerolineae bacterium]
MSERSSDTPFSDQPVDHPAEHIHMPSPSLSPIVLALGLTVLGFGLAFGVIPIVLGAILTTIGLGTWIADDIRSAAHSDAAH